MAGKGLFWHTPPKAPPGHHIQLVDRRPAGEDSPLSVTVANVSMRMFERAAESYSATELDHNRICQPFTFEGQLWICYGQSWGPLSDNPRRMEAFCRRVVLLGNYSEQASLWWATGPYLSGLTGRVALYRQTPYAICGQEIQLVSFSGAEPVQLSLW